MKERVIAFISLLASLCLTTQRLEAQTDVKPVSLEERQLVMSVNNKIKSFIDELEDLSAEVQNAPADVYPVLLKRYNSTKLRWNTYYQSYQGFIADYEELMQAVIDYGVIDDNIVASLEELKARMNAKNSFESAAAFIESQDSLYAGMLKKANILSASQKTAGELEKLKVKEQLIFAEVEEKYAEATAAVELLPSLKKKMDVLEESYVALKSTSAKIQEVAYKPLIERVKDYLLGFAAVAVLMMYVSMLQNKIAAAKQMKESARQMRDALKKNNDDMPCI